jgi:3D (Asp-Asp-Asp) domain-containing protein
MLIAALIPSLLLAAPAEAELSSAKKRTGKSAMARTATAMKRSVHASHRKRNFVPKKKQRQLATRYSPTGLEYSKPQEAPAAVIPLGIFTLTAYTQYHSPPAKTATGTVPEPGRTVAVDPDEIPLGSIVQIEGLGERIAEDSGGRIKGKMLDVFLPTIKHCLHFGVKQRDVEIVIR